MSSTTAPDQDFPCSISVDVPLPTERLASTALRSIQVDKELSPLVRRRLSVVPAPAPGDDGPALLRAEYSATTNRMLRVAVNSYMDSLRLVVEVMGQLDVDVLGQERRRVDAAAAEQST